MEIILQQQLQQHLVLTVTPTKIVFGGNVARGFSVGYVKV